MIFNDFLFLFFFLPIVLIGFHAPGIRTLRIPIIIIASFIFYEFSGGLRHLGILIADMAWVYWLSKGQNFRGDKRMLALSIVLPAFSLTFFKYGSFITSTILLSGFTETQETFSLFRDAVLPAGISFFTFQLISYCVDRYRGTIPTPPDLASFVFYISFFPQLIAGPIIRYMDVSEFIRGIKKFRADKSDWSVFFMLLVFGLAIKVLVADTLGRYILPFISAPSDISAAARAYVVFAYSFQIYFDFLGYSLIAIGLGRIIGIQLPENFRMPYCATNPQDFWRRWHITLSYWIRDYLYLPLGGNVNYLRNIVFVFAFCGLWHGAGWNFVVWGLYHAGLVIIFHKFRDFWERMIPILQRSLTFVLVSLGWLFFIFDFTELQLFFAGFFSKSPTLFADNFEQWAFLALAAVIAFKIDVYKLSMATTTGPNYPRLAAAGTGALFIAVLMFLDISPTFIYFRF